MKTIISLFVALAFSISGLVAAEPCDLGLFADSTISVTATDMHDVPASEFGPDQKVTEHSTWRTMPSVGYLISDLQPAATQTWLFSASMPTQLPGVVGLRVGSIRA